jgi:hypothetical protein
MRDHLRAFYSQLKSKVGNILAKAAALRIDLKIDGAPIASRSHTHPHSQTSRLFSSSLSFGIPFPLHPVCRHRLGWLRGPMHLCACMSEERSNGEGAGSQALSLLSDSIFWEHQNAYTATMQLNTARSTAADIQNAQNHTHTTPTHTRAGQAPRNPVDRALCLLNRRRVHAQTYFSSTECHQSSFASGGVPVVTCTCIFRTSSRQQDRRHANPSFPYTAGVARTV